MPALRYLSLAAVAASLLITGTPDAASARGGGHGGMRAAPGIAGLHKAMPLALAPGNEQQSALDTKQSGSQAPSQSQAAAAAAVAAATQSTPVPDAPLPSSTIAAPIPQMPAIAPLSPPPAQSLESSGGTLTTSTIPSSTASSASPSESAPSTPGGGGETLQDCMGFWDQGTHMSRAEWRAACTRTLNRLDLYTPVP